MCAQRQSIFVGPLCSAATGYGSLTASLLKRKCDVRLGRSQGTPVSIDTGLCRSSQDDEGRNCSLALPAWPRHACDSLAACNSHCANTIVCPATRSTQDSQAIACNSVVL
mmetsp:Transcript_22044/g.61332  ORF Transcript_22044/g.61332 Transcript_22044/m.61332 type:complete len:110 (+) Transcript_22044:881-1210(+)